MSRRLRLLLVIALWLPAVQSDAGEIHRALWGYPKQDLVKAEALLKADPMLVHSRDESDNTPLHIAARFGPLEMVELLLKLKSDVNAAAYNTFTPMHMVEDGKIARLLIRSGADLDQLDSWGKTPLQHAVATGRDQVVEAILTSGYKLDLQSAVSLKKRDLAMQMVKEDPGLLRRIKGGASLWGGDTPLAIAAGQGDLELVKFFLESGADVNQATTMPNAGNGEATALTNAVWGGHTEVVALLLKHGARVGVTGGKYYPSIVDYARKHSNAEIVALLENHRQISQNPPVQDRALFTTRNGLVAGAVVAALVTVWWVRKKLIRCRGTL